MSAIVHLPDLQAAVSWLREHGATGLCTDHRRLRAGDAFLAWPGRVSDGRRFAEQALAAGACACLLDAQGIEALSLAGTPFASFSDLKALAGPLAAAFYREPSAALDVVAVTGTNGKTSTAWWIAQALTLLQRRCGVVGTLGIGEPPALDAGAAVGSGTVLATGLTSPDPVQLQDALRQFADQGFAACAMEASSIGLVEQRLAGTQIDVAVFTNLTQDHLDYHGNMDAYWQAKRSLFEQPGLRAAVINIADAKGVELAAALAGRLELWTCAVNQPARLSAHALNYRDGGLSFWLQEGEASCIVNTALVGDYNVANLLGVIGALRALGLSLQAAVQAAERVSAVPGRMELVSAAAGQPQVVVDYAHTPDALDKALRALQPLARAREGELICVFGCGGNRDPGKRPQMGQIAGQLADRVVITSDNPRDEVPAQILAQIEAGLTARAPRQVIEDRAQAIEQTLLGADARDVVLIAGKGHEDYQEVAGQRRAFSDMAQARAALGRRSVKP